MARPAILPSPNESSRRICAIIVARISSDGGAGATAAAGGGAGADPGAAVDAAPGAAG